MNQKDRMFSLRIGSEIVFFFWKHIQHNYDDLLAKSQLLSLRNAIHFRNYFLQPNISFTSSLSLSLSLDRFKTVYYYWHSLFSDCSQKKKKLIQKRNCQSQSVWSSSTPWRPKDFFFTQGSLTYKLCSREEKKMNPYHRDAHSLTYLRTHTQRERHKHNKDIAPYSKCTLCSLGSLSLPLSRPYLAVRFGRMWNCVVRDLHIE